MKQRDEHLPEKRVTHTDLDVTCAVVWDDPVSTPFRDVGAVSIVGRCRYDWLFNAARAHPATYRVLMRTVEARNVKAGMSAVHPEVFDGIDDRDPRAVFQAIVRVAHGCPKFVAVEDRSYPIGELALFQTTDAAPVRFARLRAM